MIECLASLGGSRQHVMEQADPAWTPFWPMNKDESLAMSGRSKEKRMCEEAEAAISLAKSVLIPCLPSVHVPLSSLLSASRPEFPSPLWGLTSHHRQQHGMLCCYLCLRATYTPPFSLRADLVRWLVCVNDVHDLRHDMSTSLTCTPALQWCHYIARFLGVLVLAGLARMTINSIWTSAVSARLDPVGRKSSVLDFQF